MASTTRSIGNQAEALACQYLEQQGLKTLTRNFHCPRGELDLVMEDDDAVVFVEVRYRKYEQFGSGAETVNRAKQEKIITSALYYLQQHPQYADQPSRFDVVSISGGELDSTINWIKNAFMA